MRRFTLLVFILLALGARSAPLAAQDTPRLPPGPATIEAKLAELQAAPDLPEAAKAAAVDFYQRAVALLTRAQEAQNRAADFRRAAAEAPQLLATIREELGRPAEETAVTPAPETPLATLEQALLQASAELEASRRTVTELQAEAARRDERRALIPEQIARTRQQLAESEEALTAPVPEESPPFLREARRTFQEAQREALLREVEALEAEAASYDARRELLPARRDRAQRRVAQSERAVSQWQAVIADRRQVEVREAAREAERLRRQAARQDPSLRSFAEETVLRAQARSGPESFTQRIDGVSRDAAARRAALADLHRNFSAIQRRIDATGLNRATGLLLRRQYDTMPEESRLRRSVQLSQDQLERVQYELIELQDERLGTGDIDGVVRALVADAAPTPGPDAARDLEAVARELAVARRDLLDQLIADATALFDRLVDLNSAQRDMLAATQEYRGFVKERILWVRSVAGEGVPSARDFADAVTWLLSPESWAIALRQVAETLKKQWFHSGATALLFGLVWIAAVRARRALTRLGELVSRYRTDRLIYSVYAVIATTVAALPLPLALAIAGWALLRPQEQVPLAVAVGHGLRHAAVLLFFLRFLRVLLRDGGLAASHFRWQDVAIRSLRRSLRWFIPTVVPLAALVRALDVHGDDSMNASLGRAAFTAGLLLLSVFLARLLSPSGHALKRYMDQHKSGWIYRLRHVWRPLAIGLPLLFILMSWLGFHYTALQLQSRLESTLALALVLVVANGLFVRWLFVARRRVAIDDARRRRDQAATKAGTPPAGSSEAPAAPIDEDKVDLPAISAQTRQLFAAAVSVAVVVGSFIIWAEALPALRMLDRVQLYPSVRLTETTTAPTLLPVVTSAPAPAPEAAPILPVPGGSAGTAPPAPAPADVAVTLADLGFSLVVLLATWIAFKNVPGLVEIVVLQRLPLDAGARYALSTVLRYAIAIIGIVIAFNAVGLSWSRVQWLAAALTFGLAFGLQEIFANFVSGLIILAERPIRLGDTVTVGGVNGTVTRIRMRATTITDWDRKELVIPNKTFITGDVINWTLSDPCLRLIVPVGVSYGSDVDLVVKTLKEVARKNQSVLSDPEPIVVFRNFGDSTLDFELRVFIPSIEFLVSTRHALHMEVAKAFRLANIEIAFPQRDLHIRSIGDFDKLVTRHEDPAATDHR